MKDYYTILEVAPQADLPAIKQAFRRLAHRYHPDKNPDTSFAPARFRDIQEAYTVLSHTRRRAAYDEERWLVGLSSRSGKKQAITPQWLVQESRRLRDHLEQLDTYRMNHHALQHYITALLSDSHLAVLQPAGATQPERQELISQLLMAVRRLRNTYMPVVAERLRLVAAGDADLEAQIAAVVRHKTRQARHHRYQPLLLLLIVLLLCAGMVLYARLAAGR